jgi:hypothetical protein
VAESLACAGRLDVPGDNIVVVLVLVEQALPFVSRLRLGSAVVELCGQMDAGC